jgi:hypothetical protein
MLRICDKSPPPPWRALLSGLAKPLSAETLLRHASSRVRLDTDTQAVTVQKRERRAVSFVLSRPPQRLLVETGLLGCVPNLCLLEMARSVRKYCASMKCIRVDAENCAFFAVGDAGAYHSIDGSILTRIPAALLSHSHGRAAGCCLPSR